MLSKVEIQRIPRFSGLSDDASQWLVGKVNRRSYEKGELMFLEGDECSHLYVVESGLIKVYKSLPTGRELILGFFSFGEAVGEVALIDRSGYPACAKAHEASTVLTLATDAYFQFLSEFSDAPLALIRDLTLRMRNMNQRMQDLGGGGVDYRIARVLLACSQGEAPVRGGVLVPIHLARQDIADMVGARIETVIRIMSKWQKKGVIHTDGDGIWLQDRIALKEMASQIHN